MLLLAAPASLKGVLSAREAAAALARGARSAGAEVDECPVADGGEGTADALCGALGGAWHAARVADPLGRPVEAAWLLLPDGTAVVECAAAIGLPLLARRERNPLVATSRGLGELIAAAVGTPGVARLLVTLGGSATVDGGAGMREVVGRGAAGGAAPPGGGAPGAGGPLPGGSVLGLPLDVVCDVRNPLLGPRGAARAFGPQKGATPEMVEELERRLAAMVELAPYAELPGAGAAGGLGAALAALGGRLVPGAQLVLEAVGFAARAERATLVVTGEGQVDRTTFEGKAPAAVLEAAAAAGRPAVLFGGRVAWTPPGVEARALSGRRARAAADLEALGAELARDAG